VKYVRVFAGADGESHFEDVDIAYLASPSVQQQAEAIRFASFPPGWRSEHRASQRHFLIILAGSAGCQTSDGEIRYVYPGDIVLAEDTTGKGHQAWTESDASQNRIVTSNLAMYASFRPHIQKRGRCSTKVWRKQPTSVTSGWKIVTDTSAACLRFATVSVQLGAR
jgi:hypothetical protein